MQDEHWMKLLRRYLARFEELAHSQQDIGVRRACSDGQLTMLLAEVALRLSSEERVLIGRMIEVHNRLWEMSPALSVRRPPES